METIQRLLDLRLPKRQSAFLWGPRKTGKTTYLRERFPQSLRYDFLQNDLFVEFSKNPSLLREQLLAKEDQALQHPIILDEVQKVPQILDEVHWLIENKGLQFILCGSSARKLKRGQANLLGGRAWRYELFPLVSPELGHVDLLRALNQGLIPSHYLQAEDYRKSLKAYVQDYLKEEVFAEGLTRNIPAFSRFFDAMGYSHGELTNYSNIARDSGVDAKTVREYYQILSDTLLGTMIEPFKKRQHRRADRTVPADQAAKRRSTNRRQVIGKASKFYLCDVGVAGIITKRHLEEARGEAFGKAFEHLLLMELRAYCAYKEVDAPIHFWRTKTGLEVDFILGDGEVALEIKGARRVDASDLTPLTAFVEEHHPRTAWLVCNESVARVSREIRIVPWRDFLSHLWNGKII